MSYYIFNNNDCDGKYLIHVINTVFYNKNIVGAEIGVLEAQTTCSILQNCPLVYKMYCVDSYKSYTDLLKTPYSIDDKSIEFIKLTAHHNVKHSGCKERVEFLEMDSYEASRIIADNSLDFVFLDAHMSKEDMDRDLKYWYPKVKNGGLISGHDWECEATQSSVSDFIKGNNLKCSVSAYNDTFMWIKNS